MGVWCLRLCLSSGVMIKFLLSSSRVRLDSARVSCASRYLTVLGEEAKNTLTKHRPTGLYDSHAMARGHGRRCDAACFAIFLEGKAEAAAKYAVPGAACPLSSAAATA